jgi:hypothetical protein
MSLEQSVANLVTRGDALMNLVAGLEAAAQARIANIGAYYVALIGGLVDVVVDAVNGVDGPGRTGSPAQPLRTIAAALARTPVGGSCVVRLAGPYHVDAVLEVIDKTLLITSTSTTRHAITFDRYTVTANNIGYRNLVGIRGEMKFGVIFLDVTVVMPPADGAYAGQVEYQESGLVRSTLSGREGFGHIQFSYCDLVLPANPFGRLVSNLGQPLALTVFACTFVDQPLAGRVLRAQPNTATAVNSSFFPWLLTNLSEV